MAVDRDPARGAGPGCPQLGDAHRGGLGGVFRQGCGYGADTAATTDFRLLTDFH
jgi:hypothetical protein